MWHLFTHTAGADLRVHADPPRRRAVPPGRLRVGQPRRRRPGRRLRPAAPRCRCCSSPAPSGTTAMATRRARPGRRGRSPAQPLRRVLAGARARPAGHGRHRSGTCRTTDADRLAALYTPTPGTGTALRYDAMGAAAPRRRRRHARRRRAVRDGRRLPVRFAEMLRGRGELDGVRILAPRHGRLHGQQPPARRRRPHRVRPPAVRRDDVRRRRLRARRQRHDRPGRRPRCPAASASSAGAAPPAPRSGSTRSRT